MTDYVEAAKQGLKAAELADRARKEIDEVFAELDQQIRKGMNGKISIYRRQNVKRKNPLSIADATATFINDMRAYWAISVSNPRVLKGPVKDLAEWEQDPAGYPCKIGWGKKTYICEDREALERTLAELLQDPLVGEKLYALMRLGDNAEEELGAVETPAGNAGDAL